MQANKMLQYRDKIITAFKDGTFMSEHLKKSDNAAYDYVPKDVKINLSLFKDFFEYSPVDYAKKLINTKNGGKNKPIVEEAEHKISDLEDRIKTMKKKKKKKTKCG